MRKNLFAFTLYLGIGLARIAQSIDKLPADPGFDRVREIRVEGLTGLLNRSLGYLDISARLGPLLSTLFSLRYSAIVLTLFTVFITAMLALLIFVAIAEQTKKPGMAILCGAILMLIPAASESTIGNHGSIKWPLITALAVVASSQIFVEYHKFTSIALALFVGLSNPFAIFALTGFASDFLKTKRLNWKSHGVLIAPLLLTTLTQFLVWWNSGQGSRIYQDAVFRPSNGMGFFWWWIWLSPPVISLIVIVAIIVSKTKYTVCGVFAIKLALIAFSVWAIMQWESGIKDSTAVATCTISSISLIIAIQSINERSVRRTLAFSVCILLLFLSLPWFSSSWYLNASPKWSKEVAHLESECKNSTVINKEILILTNHISFTCEEIRKWDDSLL